MRLKDNNPVSALFLLLFVINFDKSYIVKPG
jgi:hypothetical protein